MLAHQYKYLLFKFSLQICVLCSCARPLPSARLGLWVFAKALLTLVLTGRGNRREEVQPGFLCDGLWKLGTFQIYYRRGVKPSQQHDSLLLNPLEELWNQCIINFCRCSRREYLFTLTIFFWPQYDLILVWYFRDVFSDTLQ